MVLFCMGISGLASFVSPQQAALLSRSSKHQSVGEPVLLTVHEELLRQGDDKTAAPATEVTLATQGVPPLDIFWSMGKENSSKNVVSSRFLSFHWELQSRAVSDQPSWIESSSYFSLSKQITIGNTLLTISHMFSILRDSV
ncbi:hypothetical protein P7K49_017414 [Saguinus oedipus]|uniref:Uncharacterized protein n=1 Tax=Saguinus oedipus TaxID=9490 RepID=A0ABQ9V2F8_SAGOE|nr:hypothetical protein P7K49_017414 [Saguinus oedipus]